jgi:hypothetical protein
VPVLLDNEDHLFRVEYRGNSLRFFIDGHFIFEDTLTRESEYVDAVGLWSQGVGISVSSFTVYDLNDV